MKDLKHFWWAAFGLAWLLALGFLLKDVVPHHQFHPNLPAVLDTRTGEVTFFDPSGSPAKQATSTLKGLPCSPVDEGLRLGSRICLHGQWVSAGTEPFYFGKPRGKVSPRAPH